MGAHTTQGLKAVFDGNDNFLSGHQITKIRRHKRQVPDLLKRDVEVRKLLLRSFPRMKTDSNQRGRAGRWVRVIHLYFRSGHSYSEVAEELKEKPRTIEMVIRAIYRAIKGLRCNSSKLCRKRNSPRRDTDNLHQGRYERSGEGAFVSR